MFRTITLAALVFVAAASGGCNTTCNNDVECIGSSTTGCNRCTVHDGLSHGYCGCGRTEDADIDSVTLGTECCSLTVDDCCVRCIQGMGAAAGCVTAVHNVENGTCYYKAASTPLVYRKGYSATVLGGEPPQPPPAGPYTCDVSFAVGMNNGSVLLYNQTAVTGSGDFEACGSLKLSSNCPLAMDELAYGDLAVGMCDDTVNLFTYASVRGGGSMVERRAALRVTMGAWVKSMVGLPGGGVAAGAELKVAVFSVASVAVAGLSGFSMPVQANYYEPKVTRLADGSLAVSSIVMPPPGKEGCNCSVWVFSEAAAQADNSTPSFTWHSPANKTGTFCGALTGVGDGGLAVGIGSRVAFFDAATIRAGGIAQKPTTWLDVTLGGYGLDKQHMLALPGGGLAVTLTTIELFNSSGLASGGQKYATLEPALSKDLKAMSSISALHGGGLAVSGNWNPDVYFYNASAVASGGDPYKVVSFPEQVNLIKHMNPRTSGARLAVSADNSMMI